MKKVLFSLLALTAVSFTHTKDGLILETARPQDRNSKELPTGTRQTKETAIIGHLPPKPVAPYNEWFKEQRPMEQLTVEDLYQRLTETLEIDRNEAIMHVQMFFNMIHRALEMDKELIQAVAFPMISSFAEKMFTDAPHYATKTQVSVTTVRN